MRFFYHCYLIIVSCNSVSLGVLSMLVLRLMLPVVPTHRDRKVKEEGLVPIGSARIRAQGMMGSKEEGKLDRRMRRSSNCVTLKSYRHKQTNNNNEKHKVKSSGYSSLCGCFIEYFDICWRECGVSNIECTLSSRWTIPWWERVFLATISRRILVTSRVVWYANIFPAKYWSIWITPSYSLMVTIRLDSQLNRIVHSVSRTVVIGQGVDKGFTWISIPTTTWEIMTTFYNSYWPY